MYKILSVVYSSNYMGLQDITYLSGTNLSACLHSPQPNTKSSCHLKQARPGTGPKPQSPNPEACSQSFGVLVRNMEVDAGDKVSVLLLEQ